MKVFVISGKARSGKSTFGELLKQELEIAGYKPCIVRITSTLYEYARNYFNWDGNDSTKPRKLLQELGIYIIKQKMNKKNFLLDRLFEDIEVLSNFFNVFIITDARLIEEFEIIKRKYDDVTLIKIERNDYESDLSNEEKNHITETELDTYNEFDYIIENKNYEYLKESAFRLVDSMGGNNE